ncbi:hypothetical protein [Asaia spathodeae]|uniref:hypothetical protein n=1 Tax=Asaia spathodeae TaxID=657016 RepID=UPI002FC3CE8F
MPLSNLPVDDALENGKPPVQRAMLSKEDRDFVALVSERLASPQNSIAVSLEDL